MPDLADRRLTHLFTTPVLQHDWEDSAELNAALSDVILAEERADTGARHSNVGGWHSTRLFDDWAGEPGQELIRRIGKQMNKGTAEIFKLYGGAHRMVWRLTLWANVNRKGAYNRVHTHPNAMWSGVYHVDAGDAPPKARDSGLLVLHHPVASAAMCFFPDQSPHNYPIAAKAGRMVIFPAYLAHEVTPYEGERPRISVAFNAKFEEGKIPEGATVAGATTAPAVPRPARR